MFALAVIALLAWLCLAFLNGRFWTVTDKLLPVMKPKSSPRVAVIIPARNEAQFIGRAITSLARQEYRGELHLILVDDHSEDGTVDAAQAAIGTDPRLSVISGAPLPLGWSGKVWAMQQGWEAAQRLSPEFVLLTDADIEHAPGNLDSLLAKSEEGFDLVSLMVRLHCRGFAERLLIPAFVYFFFMLYPPRRISVASNQVAGAAGGCIFLRAQLLHAIGGFASLRGAIIDDCALAQRVKEQGGRLWLGLTEHAVSIRPYDGWAGIIRMIARTAFNQLRHSALLLIGCVLGMLLVFVVPVMLLLVPSTVVRTIAAASCVLMLVTYLPLVRFYRAPVGFALTLPLVALNYLYATVLSAARYWSGHGGAWKGRAQDV